MAKKEYIEREKVLALQTDLHFDNIEQLKYWKCRHIDPIEVQLLPAADVRLVVRAEWISVPHKKARVCSRCYCDEPYKFADADADVYDFCPHCGADMRKRADHA